tara:strand:- start:19006 stop:19524 length:519 start_codon:yes stop_codon:yes gene_type:complete
MLPEEELSLIGQFKEGGETSLETIVSRHKEPLYRFIMRYVGDASEAADLTSETFIRAYRNRERYQPKAKFQTWLFTIATNLCRDHARKRKRRPGDFASATSEASMEIVDNAETGEPSPGEKAAQNEEAALLRKAIQQLPARPEDGSVSHLAGKGTPMQPRPRCWVAAARRWK